MKRQIFILLLSTGCFNGTPEPMYLPPPEPVYEYETTTEHESLEVNSPPACDCDDWDFSLCDESEYENECAQEIEEESSITIYNPITGDTKILDNTGGGVYMDNETGDMYYGTGNNEYTNDAGEVYEGF